MMADDGELYDEFGNYIGPALDSSDDDEGSDEEVSQEGTHGVVGEDNTSGGGDERSAVSSIAADTAIVEGNEGVGEEGMIEQDAIVLHEDKVHYPSAEEVYGSNVKTVVLDEDAMELKEPLVEPVKTKVVSLVQDNMVHQSGRSASDIPESGGGLEQHPMLASDAFLTQHLLSNETTQTRRGIVLAGHLHCGKSSFVDMLLEQQMVQNHPDALGPKASLPPQTNSNLEGGTANPHLNTNASKRNAKGQHGGPRLTDTLLAEQARQLSMKMTPVTLAMPSTNGGRHYALTIMDCPGHPQFHDETVAAMRLADGVCLMVDAVEGADALHVDMVIALAVSEGLPLTLCINKVDRLIVELKLPPSDAYFKLLNIIESTNVLIQSKLPLRASKLYPPLSPERNNVCFASSQHGWCTTLHQMAQLYADCNAWDAMSSGELGENLTVDKFAKRLWGDCYLDPVRRTFHSSVRDCTPSDAKDSSPIRRTFVQFFLEPLYKLYAVCLGEEGKDVDRVLRSVGVHLSTTQLRSSARPLLRAACKRFFGPSSGGFVDMVTQHVPCPKRAAKGKVSRCYTGPMSSSVTQHMMQCVARGKPRASKEQSPSVPLMIHITKLVPSSDGESFAAFGRVYSGEVTPLQRVKVFGEAYSPEDDEDMATATVSSIFILQGRRKIELSRATAGNWVFLEGVDATIAKTATITSCSEGEHKDAYASDEDEAARIFKPLSFSHAGHESVVKLAVEPLNPAELPKMVQGLRRISKSYPMSKTKVEESGEHVLFGTGELYLDAIMHDLRHVYSDIEVKVADPVVAFRETVVDTSSLQCFAETPNKRNKLTFISEPLEEGLAERLESGKVDISHWDKKKVGVYFQTQYDWDLLSSRSVWAFGASPTHGTNMLLDDTLPSEVDKNMLNMCKPSIVQGFQWAVREGPLCEEPVRSTKIKMLDASLAQQPIYRGGGQIIPTTRRAVHSALLTASPRIMEPVYRLQVECAGELVGAIQPLISKRRGQIVQDKPIAGTPLSVVKAFMPVIDSFGFETDLRIFTQGQAMVYNVFDHWNIVPGDPMDKSIVLHPLEPSPTQHLAREFLVKTRRRKGLSEDVAISKFFHEGMREELAQRLAAEEGEIQ
jgi:U5 small nuclear ribonucleoprotein component